MKWMFLLFPLFAHAMDDGQIRVKIANVRSDKGHLLISVFDSEKGWPMHPTKAVRVARMSAKTGEMSKNFSGLKPGRYAVAMIHDENDNKKLDSDDKGAPTEGFGFSNNPKVQNGAAGFDQAAFEMKPPAAEVTVKLNYLERP